MDLALQVRLIPCLLIAGQGCVKTVRFGKATYLGDPINILRIFNEREVDELIILDVEATLQGREPNADYLRDLASECFIPVCYGGGVRSIESMRRLFAVGIEKVAINSRALEEPRFVQEAAEAFGSSSVVVAIDVKSDWRGRRRVFSHASRKTTPLDPVAYAREMARLGAGEILLTSVDRDGTMAGYDLELIKAVSGEVRVPVIACGGAGHLGHARDAWRVGAAGAAAGSIFAFTGPHRAVLINYPDRSEIESLFREGDES